MDGHVVVGQALCAAPIPSDDKACPPPDGASAVSSMSAIASVPAGCQ